MSLRDIAHQDMQAILRDEKGFSWPISLRDPAGTEAALSGFSTDIAYMVDPDTGQAVGDRVASIALPIADIVASGLDGLPRNIQSRTDKPWVVVFDDILGQSWTFKVIDSHPDRTLGVITCTLGVYVNA